MLRKTVSGIMLFLLFVSMLTLAFNIKPVKASGTVGIKAGDWIKCTYTISGWPSGTPYPEWLKVEFLSVEGTNATVRVTMHMSDGTEQNDTMTVDVAAGGGTFQGLSGFVIPSNCTTGDSVYMSGYGNVTIAGETTRTYAGAGRTVVYASFSQYGTQLTYYWDKQTGVMVESSATSGTMTATAKATETNMWQTAGALGTICIRADGSIDPPDAPILTVDNVTYTLTGNVTSDADGIVVERDNIVVDGAGYMLQGTNASGSRGTDVTGRSNVTIRNTNIKKYGYGIWVYLSSSNIISGNNITNNWADIQLLSSSNNSIYHNNIGSGGGFFWGSVNRWDDGYPSGGNYWSDYNGTDANHDGIGDTPYVIDANNIDRYPLMVPYVISGQYEIAAVYGSTPTVDGTINVLEWNDAASVSFNNTEVFVKQDGENLYIALNVTGAPLMHVEEDGVQILLDVDSDGGLTLQPDDVGLVVFRNGTLMEGNVSGGTWTIVNVFGWTAAVDSTSDMWQVEFNITYSKIDVSAGEEKAIGVSIGCALYPEEGSPTWVCWPPNSYSDMTWNPSSWGSITSAGHNWTSQHDVAIVNVSHKTVVGLGYGLNISATAANQGDYPEAFNVTLYANSSQIEMQPVVLETGISKTMTFTWNTTGFAYGNCTMSACAQPVLNETDIVDNNVTCIVSVHVGVPGDISGPTQGVYDGTTNMRDISYLILLFTTKPSSPNWNPNADVNNDGTVNMRDIQIPILNFNKHE